jgi:16S rRNA (uracil1498-N3)-methyltransferase
MQLFYSDTPVTGTCVLNEQESRHAIKVLRLVRGDSIQITDGSGILFRGVIKDPSLKGCLIDIVSSAPGNDKRDYNLHIAISPLKNHDRFEWFVEKAVEFGIDEITPVICEHTEKPGIKSDRLNNLVITAMKQSVKTRRTILNEPVRFREFITKPCTGHKLIAHCNPGTRSHFSEVYGKGSDCTVLIGPEGDFSLSETENAIRAGFVPISLGSSRLRTETAGIAACHSVYFMNL